MKTTTPRAPRPRPRTGIFGGPVDPRYVELPDGALACCSCGVAVRRPDPSRDATRTVPSFLTEGQSRSLARMGAPLPSYDVPLTRCDPCTARQVLAQQLLDAHPRIRRAHGHVGLDRLDAALAALDLIGFRGRHGSTMIETLTDSDLALHETIERLAPIGAAAWWSSPGVRSGESASGRWGHVPSGLADDAMRESRALFHRRFETPTLVPPPADGAVGCLVCGVAGVQALPSDQARVWGARQIWDTAHFGAYSRAERISGYLCPACRTALADNGNAIGVRVIERALLAYLGYTLGTGARFTKDIGRAWVTLPPGTAPGVKPWAHLDLDRLTAKLDRALWVYRMPGHEAKR